MNYLKRIANAKAMTKNVKIIYQDCEELQAIVTSSNITDEYLVSCVDELWRCDCHDYMINGLHKEEASYLCKHIMAVLFYLQRQFYDNG